MKNIFNFNFFSHNEFHPQSFVDEWILFKITVDDEDSDQNKFILVLRVNIIIEYEYLNCEWRWYMMLV
jgi:hypothetical protein